MVQFSHDVVFSSYYVNMLSPFYNISILLSYVLPLF